MAMYPINTGGGIDPEGEINITKNGTYDVKKVAQALVNVNEGPFAGYTLKTGTLYTGTSYNVPSNIIPIGVCIDNIKQNIFNGENYFYIQTNLQIIFHNAGGTNMSGSTYNLFAGTILVDPLLRMDKLKQVTKIDCRTNYINGTTFRISVWLEKNN